MRTFAEDSVFHRERWVTRLGEAMKFVEQTGRNPDPRSEDTAERSLGRWVETQRLRVAKGILHYERHLMLIAFLPSWLIHKQDSRWLQHLGEVNDFVETHGHLPTAADSQQLADWIEKQAERLPAASAARKRACEKTVPELTSGVRESLWLAAALDVAQFLNDNGALPSRKAHNDVECRLGFWLHNQRIRLRGQNAKVRARATALDAMVEGWRGRGKAIAA